MNSVILRKSATMKNLILILGVFYYLPVLSQKQERLEYHPDYDSLFNAPLRIDSLPGLAKYGPHTKRMFEYLNKVKNTHVGEGGCEDLVHAFLDSLNLTQGKRFKFYDTSDINLLTVGDIIYIEQWTREVLEKGKRERNYDNGHYMIFIGFKDKHTLICVDQGVSRYNPVGGSGIYMPALTNWSYKKKHIIVRKVIEKK